MSQQGEVRLNSQDPPSADPRREVSSTALALLSLGLKLNSNLGIYVDHGWQEKGEGLA